MAGQVSVKNLWVQFTGEHGDVQALEGIDCTVHPGEFLAVLGPSGCGKSTLIRAIAGFQPADRGEILLGGRPVHEPGPDRVLVFQEFDQLFPWRTVEGNIAYALKLQGMGKSDRMQRAQQFLHMVGLDGFEQAFPHQLSGGMKQRAAIARSLAMGPDILLMDEPFGSLDAQTRTILQEELVRIWEQVGSTIVFITHNIQEAILLGDRVMVLTSRPGRVKEIIDNPIPRPRMPETPEFMALWHKLYGLLDIRRFGESNRGAA